MSTEMRALWAVRRVYRNIRKPLLLGSYAMVIRSDTVLLVRLTYYPGWSLPGGAVDSGETFEAAALRELREECGLIASNGRLHGLYRHAEEPGDHHIAVYTVTEYSGQLRGPSREVAEAAFFPVDSLPAGIWAGHRRRVEEHLGRRAPETLW